MPHDTQHLRLSSIWAAHSAFASSTFCFSSSRSRIELVQSSVRLCFVVESMMCIRSSCNASCSFFFAVCNYPPAGQRCLRALMPACASPPQRLGLPGFAYGGLQFFQVSCHGRPRLEAVGTAFNRTVFGIIQALHELLSLGFRIRLQTIFLFKLLSFRCANVELLEVAT